MTTTSRVIPGQARCPAAHQNIPKKIHQHFVNAGSWYHGPAESGNPNLFPKQCIPRTTAEAWIRDGVKEFVTDPVSEISNATLVAKFIQLDLDLAQERLKSALLLKNGTKVYIRAIVDNFSRYVLAWQVTGDFGGIRTKEERRENSFPTSLLMMVLTTATNTQTALYGLA